MADLFSNPYMGQIFRHMSEKHNMAIIIWNVFTSERPARLNEHQRTPEDAKRLNVLFDTVAARWLVDVENICEEFGFPKADASNWIFGALSGGANHMVYMLPALDPKLFKAGWFDSGNTLRNPSRAWKDVPLLMTVPTGDGGYPSYQDYYAQCQKLGYTNLIFRPEKKSGHGASLSALNYVQRFYDWVLSGQPKEKTPYYGDILNLQVLPEEQKDFVPEPQRVTLPNKELADLFVQVPMDGPEKLRPITGDADVQWHLKGYTRTVGDWMPLGARPESGNVLVVKWKLKPSDTYIGVHFGSILFKDALVVREKGSKEPRFAHLEVRVNTSRNELLILNGETVISYSRLKGMDLKKMPADVELWYHRERKKLVAFVNGQFTRTIEAEVALQDEFTFAVEGASDMFFGNPSLDSMDRDRFYIQSPLDGKTGLSYELTSLENGYVTKWADTPTPKPKKGYRMQTRLRTAPKQGGCLVIENVGNPDKNLYIGVYDNAAVFLCIGSNFKPVKTAVIPVPERKKPFDLRVSYEVSTKLLRVFVNDAKKPSLVQEYPIQVGRIGNTVRGINWKASFGKPSITAF